ncbi:MAG TPA: hypothetical protein VIG99_01400 [Myxococcaceae bacterium]
MKLVLTSALFGALFLISGCATQCEGISAQYNTCTFEAGPRNRTVKVDGANFCLQVDMFNQRAAAHGTAGCADKWKAHLTCWNGNMANICNIEDVACDDSAAEWQQCVTDYCTALAMDPEAYDPECSDGDILIPSPFQSGF